jgi:excisionase family DNA binding protein
MAREVHARPETLAFTYRDVAHAASISERMVKKLVRSGRLRVVRIGRSVRVPRSELQRLCGVNDRPA